MTLSNRPAFRASISTAMSLLAALLLLALHYGVAPSAFGLHALLRRLFYIPVIVAAIAGGARGGLLVAAVISFAYLPHLGQLAAAGDRILDHAFELVLLPVVALLVGGYADRSRRAWKMAAERGRLAALGEVGMAMMAQLEGPLSSIAGQVETLGIHAGKAQDNAVCFAAGVIQAEVERARRFMLDLRGMNFGAEPRIRSVPLGPLLTGIVADIDPGRTSAARLVLEPDIPAVLVRADAHQLARAVRLLLTSLLQALPTASLRLIVEQGCDGPRIEIEAESKSEGLPDPRQELRAVFGASVGEYHFEQALCFHLLSAVGAEVKFRRVSPRLVRLAVRFGRGIAEPSPSRRLGIPRTAAGGQA